MKVLVFLLSLSVYGTVLAATYTIGIVPQQSAQVLAENWTPVLDQLSATTGDQYQFVTAKDIPSFERALSQGEYDFAYMNPYHYTVFAQHPGYQAFAKQADKRIRGIIVVPKDSTYQSLAQLQGMSLAFPSPAAFAATVVPQSVLASEGIVIDSHYVSSHDSVYLAVARGLFDAGGGIERTFATAPEQAAADLRILWRSDGYTPHAFAAHPSVDSEARERLAQAMISLSDSPEGRSVLQRLQFSAIESGEDSDWDDVRALNIDLISP